MSISIIAAVSLNNAIGRNGQMPWHISLDLKHFKSLTSGHTIIMGRRTWESLGCKPLPNRRNIIISSSMQPTDGIEVQRSIEFLKQFKGAQKQEEVFIIGGGELYRKTIEMADCIYLTEVQTNVPDADTFFPEISRKNWQCTEKSDIEEDPKSGIKVIFKKYQRILS